MPTTLIRYRWRVTSETSGKRVVTRWHMTEADAMARYPDAERLDDTREAIEVPDDPLYQGTTSAWQRGTPSHRDDLSDTQKVLDGSN